MLDSFPADRLPKLLDDGKGRDLSVPEVWHYWVHDPRRSEGRHAIAFLVNDMSSAHATDLIPFGLLEESHGRDEDSFANVLRVGDGVDTGCPASHAVADQEEVAQTECVPPTFYKIN